MYRISDNLIDGVLANQQQIEKYKRGEINAGELKSGNVKLGVYEQRKDGTFMAHPPDHPTGTSNPRR